MYYSHFFYYIFVFRFEIIYSETKIESETSFMNFLEGGNIGRRSYKKFNNTIEVCYHF